MDVRFVHGRSETDSVPCSVTVNHSHDQDDKTTVDGLFVAITALGVGLGPISYCQVRLSFDESRNLANRILRAIGDRIGNPL